MSSSAFSGNKTLEHILSNQLEKRTRSSRVKHNSNYNVQPRITALTGLIDMFSSGVALTSALAVGFSTMWSPKFVDSLMARLKALGAPKVPWLRLAAYMFRAR